MPRRRITGLARLAPNIAATPPTATVAPNMPALKESCFRAKMM